MDKFKIGDLVINSSGTYAKIYKIENGVCFASRWTNDLKTAIEGKVAGIMFNEKAVEVLGIKLAKEKKAETAKTTAPKTAKEIKAEKEAKEKAEKETKTDKKEIELMEDEDIEAVLNDLPDAIKAEILNEGGYVEITEELLNEYPELETAGAEVGQKIKFVA